MQLNITGHHVEITPALRAYVTEKMQRLTRHFDQVVSINVIMKVEKLEQLAEATVIAGGRKLFATDTDPDMYAAIDGLIDKLDRQVRRLKGRLREHHHAKPEQAISGA
jgi:putative sigma-54 modulation protein